jgi:hypothetical protein
LNVQLSAKVAPPVRTTSITYQEKVSLLPDCKTKSSAKFARAKNIFAVLTKMLKKITATTLKNRQG